jgi:phage tail protein X
MAAAFTEEIAMTGTFRLIAVVTVLTVGACGAALFRKPMATETADPGADTSARWANPRAAGAPRIVAGPTWVAETPNSPAPAPAHCRAPTAVLGDARSPEPPDLPSASPIGNPIGPFALASGRGGEMVDEERGAEPRRLPGARRTHRVEDGDTLGSLALRYLGDANRGDEIADLNRGVIGPGGALPIGVALEIPDRSAKPAAPADLRYGEPALPGDRDAGATRMGILPSNESHAAPSVPVEMGVIRPSRERAAP